MATAHEKQFTLYSHPFGSNPWKVALVLEELGLSYHTIYFNDWAELKTPEYLAICPVGTVPLLVDHYNAEFKIWDSGAIVLYLIEKYDKEHKISFNTIEKEALAKQYLLYQSTTQSQSYREVLWYTLYAPEDVPTVIARHVSDVRKILTMISTTLETSENGFLVGGRPSYADLCFLPYNWVVGIMPGLAGWESEFPLVAKWEGRVTEKLGCVKKVKDARGAALSTITT